MLLLSRKYFIILLKYSTAVTVLTLAGNAFLFFPQAANVLRILAYLNIIVPIFGHLESTSRIFARYSDLHCLHAVHKAVQQEHELRDISRSVNRLNTALLTCSPYSSYDFK